MKPGHPIQSFLQRHRRHARGTLLLWAGAATLGALAFGGLARLGWIADHPARVLIAIAAAALLLVAWFLRARRLTAQRLARGLDARWALRARLESALELAGNESSWAVAQRDDAARSLATRPAPGALAWRSGQFLLGLAAALLLVEGTTLLVRSLRAAWLMTATKPGTKTNAAPIDQVRASIEWKSPDAEIKATAIEEVPLTALADSNTGFRSFSLEIVVNGEREVSQPLAPAELGGAIKPGAHELGPSLFLDQLSVKPFDVVSYRLVGELATPGPKRTVASLPQLVQIRPPQKDAAIAGKGGTEFAGRLFALKAAQIQLIKQNAVLAQLGGREPRDPTWAPENARVADEQAKLAAGAAELRAWAKPQRPPPLILDNLADAATAMKTAGGKIAATENEAAAKPQNHALALLTELEQFIKQAISGAGPPATDPIRDEQVFKLPSRSETPAGKLEELAAQQKTIATEIAAAAAGGTPTSNGDPKAEEAALARGAASLGQSDSFSPTIQKEVAAAATAADEAARQLALGDISAARVPAAAAQRALELAVEAQEKAGRAAATAQLEELRRALNAASRASADARAAQLDAARTTLRAAALEQQRTGSAEAAQELAQLANLVGAAATGGKRAGGAGASPLNPDAAIRELASAATHAQVQLSAHTAALSRAVRRLSPAGQPPASDRFGTVELASQEAQWLTIDGPTIELAQQTATRADALQRAGADDATKRRGLEDSAAKLAAALEHGRAPTDREQIARSFNPVDVDPDYREAVEDYFARLSRDDRRKAAK